MDLNQAQALARMQEGEPDYTCSVLQDSGYGDLAEQWRTATSEFHNAAQQSHTADPPQQDSMASVVRAYARMCVSWSRITQLRDQALGSVERLTRRN